MSSSKHSSRTVGLDLGSRSLKVVVLERTPAGHRLLRTLIQELPAAPGGSVDQSGWLESAVKDVDAREVRVSIGGPDVALRRVHMPLMSRAELQEAVKWQVKDQVPFPIQEAEIDVQVLGEVWEKDIKKQDVLVVAALRSYVERLVASVERAGVRVAGLIPAETAAWQCVATCLPDATQGSVALVDVGAATTTIAIAKDGHIRVVRDLSVGSASVTDALVGVVASEQGEITIDHAKAEAIKRQYGVLPEAREGTTEEGVPLFHVASLIRPVLEHLLTELSRLFDFYKVQMDEAGVSKVLLCGGGATLKALPQFLADGLGLTVEIFNPLLRMPDRAQAMQPEQIAEEGPRLTVAIGLALDDGRALNVTPPGRQRMSRVAALPQAWRRAGLVTVAAAGLVLAGMLAAAGWLGWQLQQRERLWAQVEPAYRQSLETAAETARLTDAVRQGQALIDRQPFWEGIFKEVAALVPPTLELTEMGVTSDADRMSWRLQVKGRVADGGASAEGSVAQCVEWLEHSAFFQHAELVSSEMHSSDPGKTSFEIEADLE